VKQCAEKYVDHDVDCPDQHIGHCHFAWLPHDIPEKQNIQGNRSGNHHPFGCTRLSTLYPNRQTKQPTASEANVHLFVNQVETESPR
jgi:hypothetical protein